MRYYCSKSANSCHFFLPETKSWSNFLLFSLNPSPLLNKISGLTQKWIMSTHLKPYTSHWVLQNYFTHFWTNWKKSTLDWNIFVGVALDMPPVPYMSSVKPPLFGLKNNVSYNFFLVLYFVGEWLPGLLYAVWLWKGLTFSTLFLIRNIYCKNICKHPLFFF